MTTTPTQSPYIEARRAWDERYGDALVQARNWRLVALASMATAVTLAGGYYVESSRDKIVPYVIAVDQIGQSYSVGAATKTPSIPPAAIKVALEQWLDAARTVYRDSIAQKVALERVYAIATPASKSFLDDWYKVVDDGKHNPLEVMKTSSVSIAINSYMPLSDNTVQITWTETTRTLAGEVSSVKKWQANLTYIIEPPKRPEDIKRNPLGIQLKSVSWAELQ